MAALATLDWIVLASYVCIIVGLGWWFGRGQGTSRDYFLAGGSAPSWAIGLSIVATQAGAISLIGAPAFVALHPEGGMRWLQYELAVPIAMMVLLVALVPTFHRLGAVSVYEYLERRFDGRTRRAVSVAFQVGRALATGVAIYALAIVVSVLLEWPLVWTIVGIGVVTIAYDVMGGMRGVIATDVLQMTFIVVGLSVAIFMLLSVGGGADALLAAADGDRIRTLDLEGSGFDGSHFAFWPMLLGGFFLYAAYYGTDQTQMQRLLSARNVASARRAVVFGGMIRFPLVLAYSFFGLLLAGYLVLSPEFAAKLPAGNADYLVPTFLVEHMPAGALGLLLAAILAAAMSSLDSALNSLSAASIEDVVRPRLTRPLSDEAMLRLARGTTLGWGVVCTLFALGASAFSSGVLEAINMVGSLFYGPILAVFVLGLASRRATGTGALAGLLAGLGLNLALWLGAPQVSWLWWNVFGFAAAIATGLILRSARPGVRQATPLTWRTERGGIALPSTFGAGWIALSIFFAAMIGLTAVLPGLLR